MSNKTQIGLALVMVAAAMMAAATNLTAKRETIYLRDELYAAQLRISALEAMVRPTNWMKLPGGGWIVPTGANTAPGACPRCGWKGARKDAEVIRGMLACPKCLIPADLKILAAQ